MVKPAAIGFRMHSGWGALVVVSTDIVLKVVDRTHIVVAEAEHSRIETALSLC